MCRRAFGILGLVVLMAAASSGHAGPPVVMQDSSGAGRLNGLMLLLAIENLKRRPALETSAPESSAPASRPLDQLERHKRLMGIAEMHNMIAPTAGQPRRQ